MAACLKPVLNLAGGRVATPSALQPCRRAQAGLPQPRIDCRRRPLPTPPRAADPAVAANPWWANHPDLPNLRDVDGLDGLLAELSAAGDKLVVLDVYGTWCGACRAVFPKFVKLAEQHDDVIFLKMAFDENKAVARALGVKALPAFLCFRGDDGKLECFTAGPSKAGALAAAIERHNSPRCQLGAPAGVPELAALAAERRAAAEVALAGAAAAASTSTGAAGVA